MKRLLGLLCGLLVAMIAVELAQGTGRDKAGDQNVAVAAPVMPAASKRIGPAADAVDQWVAVALARPLFAADRKPPDVSPTDWRKSRADMEAVARKTLASVEQIARLPRH